MALKDFSVRLISGCYFGDIPPTPLSHETPVRMPDAYAELLNVSLAYGYTIGYTQEQNGKLIHHLFPIKSTESEQISTSSKVDLALHTETAFHPYKPDYVVLACLRGDKTAATTYADVETLVKSLSTDSITELLKVQYTTRVDASFRTNGEQDQQIELSILKETSNGYQITHDQAFVQGTNKKAQTALDELNKVIASNTEEVTLRAGDVLIINNSRAIHGRKPFNPRYDGTDRWLLRCLVREELPPESERRGSVITTERF